MDNIEGKKKFWIYRSVSKCFSDGVSFLTDDFLKLLRLTLPILLPLAACMAYVLYSASSVQAIMDISSVGFLILLAIFLLFVFYTAMESFIYSSVKFKAAGLDIASIKFRDIYKGVFGLFPKMLLFNVISLLLTAIPVGLVMLPFLIVRDSVESDIAFYVATVLAVLAVIVLTVPYNMVLPNIMLGKGGFFKSLFNGYALGMKKWGKVFALSLVVSIIVNVVSSLLLSPALIFSMIQYSASYSVLNGDAVNLPNNFGIWASVILFLSSFMSLILLWLEKMPFVYLYTSFVVDEKNEKESDAMIGR